MKANKGFNLNKYSGIAGVFLILHNNSEAQVIYTDIEPDIILDVSGETAFLDIDNNGVVDFAFLKIGGTFPIYDSSSIYLGLERVNYIYAGPYIYGNKIAGGFLYHSWSGSYWYLPDDLSFLAQINSQLDFYGFGFQVMAGIISHKSSIGVWLQVANYGGWMGQSDHYLGVYFADNDNLFHYGWIRCSVSDSADQLTIKDYAYNTAIETGLLAGTLISGIENGENDSDISIYTNSKNVHIHSEQAKNGHLLITDLSGKAVLEMQLSSEYEVIDMQLFPAGMYIVKINWSNRYFTQKINIY